MGEEEEPRENILQFETQETRLARQRGLLAAHLEQMNEIIKKLTDAKTEFMSAFQQAKVEQASRDIAGIQDHIAKGFGWLSENKPVDGQILDEYLKTTYDRRRFTHD